MFIGYWKKKLGIAEPGKVTLSYKSDFSFYFLHVLYNYTYITRRYLVKCISPKLLLILKGVRCLYTEYLWIQQMRESQVKENRYLRYQAYNIDLNWGKFFLMVWMKALYLMSFCLDILKFTIILKWWREDRKVTFIMTLLS